VGLGAAVTANAQDPASLVAAYKQVLREVLERRPSGMRQRLAEALGTTRSFVSQISNPSYSTPIPAPYIATVLDVCHFSEGERTRFLAAYRLAHPRRAAGDAPAPGGRLRTLTLSVPDFGNETLNDDFDAMLTDMVARVRRLMTAAPK
jgi:hypothetical protein